MTVRPYNIFGSLVGTFILPGGHSSVWHSTLLEGTFWGCRSNLWEYGSFWPVEWMKVWMRRINLRLRTSGSNSANSAELARRNETWRNPKVNKTEVSRTQQMAYTMYQYVQPPLLQSIDRQPMHIVCRGDVQIIVEMETFLHQNYFFIPFLYYCYLQNFLCYDWKC